MKNNERNGINGPKRIYKRIRKELKLKRAISFIISCFLGFHAYFIKSEDLSMMLRIDEDKTNLEGEKKISLKLHFHSVRILTVRILEKRAHDRHPNPLQPIYFESNVSYHFLTMHFQGRSNVQSLVLSHLLTTNHQNQNLKKKKLFSQLGNK